jgi:hypothetical protein
MVVGVHVYIPATNAGMLSMRQLTNLSTGMNIPTHQKTVETDEKNIYIVFQSLTCNG